MRILTILIIILLTLWYLPALVGAEEVSLIASWYSIQSLKDEGTYKYSKGVMANGRQFSDVKLTCASRKFPLGSKVKITNTTTNAAVVVLVTDRISKRFKNKRIDLSKKAFSVIAPLKKGVVRVKVKRCAK